MCGRYTITTPAKELAARFGLIPPAEPYKPTDDARPTGNFPIVLNDEPNQMVIGHWGYPMKIAGKEKELINVRAESILEKPYFQKIAEKHRCIILADGFYEWKKIAGGKAEKYRFTLEHKPMAFAGIYEWKEKKTTKEIRPFFSIITAPANVDMNPIHDRMPVILLDVQAWLENYDPKALLTSFVEKLTISPLA